MRRWQPSLIGAVFVTIFKNQIAAFKPFATCNRCPLLSFSCPFSLAWLSQTIARLERILECTPPLLQSPESGPGARVKHSMSLGFFHQVSFTLSCFTLNE